jgi:hypothetical protein
MSRSNNRISDYFQATAETKGVSLFPSGLLMYDLPSLRRTASRTSNNVELTTQQPSRKQSPSPVPSVGSIKRDDFSRYLIYLVFIIIFNSR